jgi:osmotically-inducible protein OsmY
MDPTVWDVVINTGALGVPQAVELLAGYVEGGHLQPNARDLQRLQDVVLSSRVESAILTDANVWVSNLRVTAERGRVRIEGEVITEEDRDAAEDAARLVPGVGGIENEVRVQPPPLTGM